MLFLGSMIPCVRLATGCFENIFLELFSPGCPEMMGKEIVEAENSFDCKTISLEAPGNEKRNCFEENIFLTIPGRILADFQNSR